MAAKVGRVGSAATQSPAVRPFAAYSNQKVERVEAAPRRLSSIGCARAVGWGPSGRVAAIEIEEALWTPIA
jgi:hypothetical protein